jgi:hypothetical protein
MSDPKPPRVDPAVIQQWRDRQLKNIPKEKLSKAEEITAASRLAELFSNPQVLHGKLTRTGASGGTVQVALDKPYKGLSSIPATAATGCDRFGKVTLLPDKDKNWYAFGGGVQKIRSARDIERSSDPGKPSVTGEIAYCYAVFLKRRVNTSANYKWFWQVFVGGWQAENILVKEWEVPESITGTGIPRSLPSPVAIVDFRGDTFYVSLQYTLWVSNASQQRYALFKGTKKEDLETRWDKSTNEMLPSVTSLSLSPRGFGYWSSQTDQTTNYSLYDGAIAAHPYVYASADDRTTLIPQGWKISPKAVKYTATHFYNSQEGTSQSQPFPVSTGTVTNLGNSPDVYANMVVSTTEAGQDSGNSTIHDLVALYRLSEDGENQLSGSSRSTNADDYHSHGSASYTPVPTAHTPNYPYTVGGRGGVPDVTYYAGINYTYTSTWSSLSISQGGASSTVLGKLQGNLVYSYEKTSSSATTFTGGSGGGGTTTTTSDPPAVIKIDMPEKGGNLPFMAKLADVGNAFTTSPANPAIATGSVSSGLIGLSPGAVIGVDSPYLTDVHPKFISAIQCPDLLNRGTTESQNIYGDLSPIYPVVANAGDLSALATVSAGVPASVPNGAAYGVTALLKVYTFNSTSTATVNGTSVLNALNGSGRWLERGALGANPATADEKKLPGVLTLWDLFPEMLTLPPATTWIGWKNIEHENRTVNVFLWNPELTAPYNPKSIEVEVQKIDAVKKIIEDDTLQQLLSYTFVNASFG